MLISFPNMGPNWVAFKTLFTSLDLDVVVPDPTNREAIKIGVKQSPEFVCFPFKALVFVSRFRGKQVHLPNT